MRSRRISIFPAAILITAILGWTLQLPAYGIDADISVDGALRDWRRIPGISAETDGATGEIKAANDSEYLYVCYEGSWTSWMSYSVDVYVDGQPPESPFGTLRINDSADDEQGTFSPLNSWSAPISDSEGVFVSDVPGEFWGYENLVFEFSVSLAALGYSGDGIPEIELVWITFDDASITASPLGEEPEEEAIPEETPEDPAEQPVAETPEEEAEVPAEETTGSAVDVPVEETTGGAVDSPAEETTDGAIELPEEETTDSAVEMPEETEETPFDFGETTLSVSSALVIDGYYSDWDSVLHSDIGWGGSFVHSGALVLQDDALYVHLIAADNWNNKQLPTSAMHLYINGNIQYDSQGNPTEDSSMMLQLAEVNGDMTMGSPLKNNLKGPLLLDDLGAFEYDGWPKRYLGEAAFTIFDRNHVEGDQCEYKIDMAQIADYFGVDDNEIYEITMYFPRLGAQLLTVTGVSTGPYIGVALGVLIAGGVLLLRKKKKGPVQ